MSDRVVVIKGPLTDDDVNRISGLIFRLQGDRRVEVAEGKIVEVAVETEDNRIVRVPVGKLFDFIRWDFFRPEVKPADV